MFLGGGIPADRPCALAVKPPSDAKAAAHPPSLRVTTNPTPPLTPVLTDNGSPTSSLGLPSPSSGHDPVLLGPSAGLNELQKPMMSGPLEFEWDYQIQRDPEGYPVELGRGAWSIVYRAVCNEVEPVSPADSEPAESRAPFGRLLAVKKPLRGDAHRILKAEASLLTRLSKIVGHENHLVPFMGYHSQSCSTVMEEVSLTLSNYINTQAGIARANFSTRTMFDPVLGMSKWLELSTRLIKGLAWLHDQAQVLHGDIKPQNILLRRRDPDDQDAFPFDPLYMDFTSSDDLSSSATYPRDHGLALSALTPPYAAPELLRLSLRNANFVSASKASDIFSLAITLLTAVTGNLLLYPSADSQRSLLMAKEGHSVLQFVRSDANGTRVPNKGVVERILAPAVAKDPESRVHPAAWLDLVRNETEKLNLA